MENREYNEYGARVERGIIIKKDGSAYTVESYDRPGITTPPMSVLFFVPSVKITTTHDKNGTSVTETLNASYNLPTFDVGDSVLFVLFDEGAGIILGKYE